MDSHLPLFLLLSLCSIAQAQSDIYEGLVFGIGPGTFAVAIAAIIGIILCGLQNICKLPGIMILIGIALPLLVFLFCYLVPKQSSSGTTTDDAPTDAFRWKLAMLYLVVVLGLVTALIGVLVEVRIDLYPGSVGITKEESIFQRPEQRPLQEAPAEADPEEERQILRELEDNARQEEEQPAPERAPRSFN